LYSENLLSSNSFEAVAGHSLGGIYFISSQ